MKVKAYWKASGTLSDVFDVADKAAFQAWHLAGLKRYGPCEGLPRTKTRSKGRVFLFEDEEVWDPCAELFGADYA